MPADQKLKILFLAANPINTPQLRLDQELRDVQTALRQSRYRDQLELQAVWATRITEMRRAMLEVEPQILHFSGHGEGGAIFLEDNAGNAHPIAADAFAKFLKNFTSVKCVLLNACYSEELAAALNTCVPFVVGMETAVEDDAAITFAVAFYDGLGSGRSYESSYDIAASTLELEDKLAAVNPVLTKGPSAVSVPPPITAPIAAPIQPAEPAPAQPVANQPVANQPSASAPNSPPAGPPSVPTSITRLSGPQFKQFHEALLAAFDQEALTQMVRLEMGVNISSVAGGSNFSAVAFNLIDWAQRTGRLGELITAAARSNGANPEIKAFVASLHN